MRLLPRSPAGTWLLAAAVWLAACGGAWHVLPPRPGADWPLDHWTTLAGFGPGGRTVVTYAHVPYWKFKYDPPPEPTGIRVWDVATGAELRRFLDGHFVRDVTISPGGRWLAVEMEDSGNRQVILDAETGREVLTVPTDAAPHCRAFAADDGSFACFTWRSNVQRVAVFGLPDATERAMVPGRGVVALSADGAAVACAEPPDEPNGEPDAIVVWDVATGRPRATLRTPPGHPSQLWLSSDAAILTAMWYGGPQRDAAYPLGCWDVATGRELVGPTDVWAARPSADGQTLLTLARSSGGVRRVTVWDVPAGRPRAEVAVESDEAKITPDTRGLLLSPDGQVGGVLVGEPNRDRLAEWAERLRLPWPRRSTTAEASVLFDTTTSRETARLPREGCWGHCSPDGSQLAVRDWGDHRVRVWDMPPRPPVAWLVITAAGLAVPVAGLAWRRTRKLRTMA
jgi:WD40 repeat protein